jgi:hypothetical protein
MLAEKRERIWQDARRIREEWERGGIEEQRQIQRMWKEQLENDPAWETEEEVGEKSRLWQEFWEEMNPGC